MESHCRRTNHIGSYPGSGIVGIELVFILCTLLERIEKMGNKEIAEFHRHLEILTEDVDFLQDHVLGVRVDNLLHITTEVHFKDDGTLETFAEHFGEHIERKGFTDEFDQNWFIHNGIKYYELVEKGLE